MATANEWIAGARPRTLPAAVAPVVIGTAAAHEAGRGRLGYAVLALLVALALQVGVNYANDYSDGVRGTDTTRVGPVRLVGQELADPRSVKMAAFGSFGVAGVVGLVLITLAHTWWLLPLGALAVLAAWRYTGGDNPYGYRGLGEVYVFLFFGLLATLGTEYTQVARTSGFGVVGAVGVGVLASAILVANNLRDIPTDAQTGKRTLAVRLGDAGTRRLYAALLLLAYLAVLGMALWQPWALLALVSLPVAWRLVAVVRRGASGKLLIPVLAGTGLLEVGYAVLVALGVLVGAMLG